MGAGSAVLKKQQSIEPKPSIRVLLIRVEMIGDRDHWINRLRSQIFGEFDKGFNCVESRVLPMMHHSKLNRSTRYF
jgi:hypothetical protein